MNTRWQERSGERYSLFLVFFFFVSTKQTVQFEFRSDRVMRATPCAMVSSLYTIHSHTPLRYINSKVDHSNTIIIIQGKWFMKQVLCYLEKERVRRPMFCHLNKWNEMYFCGVYNENYIWNFWSKRLVMEKWLFFKKKVVNSVLLFLWKKD